MSFDFRSSQIRTNKLISSGSTGTNAKLLVYDIAADGVPANQGNINTTIFPTSSIGTDVFIYFSGSSGTRGIGGTYGTIVFGGDICVSGTTYLSSSTVTGNMTVSNILSASTLTANTLSGYNLSASNKVMAGGDISGSSNLNINGGANIRGNTTVNIPDIGDINPGLNVTNSIVSKGLLILGDETLLGEPLGVCVVSGGLTVSKGGLNIDASSDTTILHIEDALDAGNNSGSFEVKSSNTQFYTETNYTVTASNIYFSSIYPYDISLSYNIGSNTNKWDKSYINSGTFLYNVSASLISGSEIKVSNGIILSPLLSSSFGEAQSYNSGKILFESNSGSLVLNNNGSYEIISTNKNILQKLDISNYKITSTGVSASAEVICQYPIMSSELSKLVPSTGNGRLSSFKLKVVLSTTTGSLPAYVRLLNLSTPAYIDISGENTYILSSSSLTPTVITSSNILVDPNFNYNDSIYELQLFSSGSGSGSAILGSAQFIFN